MLGSITFELEQCCPDLSACIEVDRVERHEPTRYWGKSGKQDARPGVWSCFAEPIYSTNGDRLGRLVTTRPHSGSSHTRDLQLIGESAILAAIAIERDRSDRMIWKQANYDALTGLPNRNLMRERLGQELNKVRRHGLPLGLMFIDLDHLKQVNDTLGHHKGDELLAQVGVRLSACMRDSDTVARLGGDEFTVVATELGERRDVERIAAKILLELAGEFRLGAESVYLSASIGIAFYPDHGEDMDALIDCADHAMYDAKNSGGNRFVIYSDP